MPRVASIVQRGAHWVIVGPDGEVRAKVVAPAKRVEPNKTEGAEHKAVNPRRKSD